MDENAWRVALQRHLDRAHDAVLAAVEGVGEFDQRRPLTPTGTSMLGLIRHLVIVEHGYLVRLPGRHCPAMETVEEPLELYARVAEASAATLRELPLDTPVAVPWWSEAAATTVGVLALHVIAETSEQAGHLEILRELLDGANAVRPEELGEEQRGYIAKIQAEAEHFS